MKTGLRLAVMCLLLAACAVVAGAAPVHDAAAKGDLGKIRALVKKNRSLIKAKDKDGATPLHYASAGGSVAVVKYLIGQKANVNAQKRNGVTPLHAAAAYGRKEVAELLLAAGADIAALDKQGRTPLAVAQANGRTAVVELLTMRGAAPQVEAAPPAPQPPAVDTCPEALAKSALASIQKGDFAEVVERFDATMKQRMSEAALSRTWAGLVAQTGPLVRQGAPAASKVQGYDVVDIPCEFQKAKLNFRLAFNSAREISGLFFLKP